MKRSAKIFFFMAISVVIVTAIFFFWFEKKYSNRVRLEKERIAQEIQKKIVLDSLERASKNESAEENSEEIVGTAEVPEKKLLQIPFYSQAPFGNWDEVHEDMCEEASLLNAGLFLEEKKLSLDDYEKELMNLKDLEEKLFGEWKSNPIADIKELSDEYFSGRIKSKVVENPTVDSIEAEIAAGRPVVLPLAGREIGNPNFTPPGPIYHMLVVKGYDTKNFITNDVGTRKGNSYVYRKEILMEKIYDWNEVDIHSGARRMLVLFK